jgi:hypothetical protein
MFPFSTLSHLTVHSRSWMGTVLASEIGRSNQLSIVG